MPNTHEANKVPSDPLFQIERMRGGDGYDVMGTVEKEDWLPVGIWGRDGWDAGEWPLVVFYVKWDRAADKHFLAYYVEGDVDTYSYDTREERNAHVDELVFWHWKAANKPWVEGVEKVEDLDPKYRGPCTSERMAEAVAESMASQRESEAAGVPDAGV